MEYKFEKTKVGITPTKYKHYFELKQMVPFVRYFILIYVSVNDPYKINEIPLLLTPRSSGELIVGPIPPHIPLVDLHPTTDEVDEDPINELTRRKRKNEQSHQQESVLYQGKSIKCLPRNTSA